MSNSRLKQTTRHYNALLYRALMKVAHKYHWHYAPPVYPEGDTQLWCKWCGFRQTVKYGAPAEENTLVGNTPTGLIEAGDVELTD